MRCQTCRGKTRVVDSRWTKTGGLRRRRECVECHARFTTYEIVSDRLREVQRIRILATQAMAMAQRLEAEA